MSDCFLGEIRMFGGNYAPQDWAFCDGGSLPISQFDALYSLIGTTYGGDGVNTFNLPDLRGRIPVHMGQGSGLTPRAIGNPFGTEAVTLDVTQIPAHNHVINVGGDATSAAPAGSYPGNSINFNLYSAANPDQTMSQSALAFSSPSPAQPHSNLMPALCVNFIIALNGLYPTRP